MTLIAGPDFPRGLVFSPKLVEVLGFLVSVHRLPETLVLEGMKFDIPNQLVHRFALQHYLRIKGKVVEHPVIAHHVATIHKGVLKLGFFTESMDTTIILNPKSAKPARRMNRRNGAGFTGILMRLD